MFGKKSISSENFEEDKTITGNHSDNSLCPRRRSVSYMSPEESLLRQSNSFPDEPNFDDIRDTVINFAKHYTLLEAKKKNPSKWKLIASQVSLESILNCPISLSYFYKFVNSEYNSENVDAYIEIQALFQLMRRRQPNTQKIFQKAITIITKYVLPGSKCELNITSNLRNELTRMLNEFCSVIEKPELETSELISKMILSFEALNKEVIVNLTDPYQRFLESDLNVELFTVLYIHGAESVEHKRQRFFDISKHECFLNSPENWVFDYNARHPDLVASELLMKLLVLVKNTNNKDMYGNIQISRVAKIRTIHKEDWNKFSKQIHELSKVNLDLLETLSEKKAFFINCYNLLLLHAAVMMGDDFYQLDNYYQREMFQQQFKYIIGGYRFNLEKIKNGILRGNKISMGLWKRRFSINDKRTKFILPYNEPYVLFVLGDLTWLSPKIELMKATEVEEQMRTMTEEYLKEFVIYNDKEVILPSLLRECEAVLKAKNKTVIQFVESTMGVRFNPKAKVTYAKNNLKPSFACVVDRKPKVDRRFALHKIIVDRLEGSQQIHVLRSSATP